MPEEIIRAVFAHIEKVRERWSQEVSYVNDGDYISITYDHDEVSFMERGYDHEVDFDEIPFLALVDFDAAASVALEAKRARDLAWATETEERERRQLESLLLKYGQG